MGTLGLAAVLAVALAALRGTAGAITDWRQRRMEAAAEAAPLRAARLKLQEAQMKADAAGAGSGGRVPSSNEYGRRSLARTGSGGGGSGGGGRSGGRAGGGSSSGGRTGPGRSLASSGSPGSRTGSPSGSGGTGPGRKGSGSPSGGSGSSTTRSTGTNKGSSSGSGPGSGGKAGGSGGGSGKGSSSGSSSGGGGGRRPGVLGQLALDGSKRRTARHAGERKEAARQQKADLAERKRAGKDGDASKSTGAGGTSSKAPGATGKDGSKSAGTGRVTLGKALGDETRRRAEERLRRRREDPDPPFLRRVPRDGAETAEGAATTSTEDDTEGTSKSGPETATGGPTATGSGAGSSTGPDGATGPDWEYWEPPGGGGRRNPWDSLFEAEWDARVVWTVEQVDPPGAHAKRWEPEAIAPARAGLPAGVSSSTSSTATAAPAATVTTTKETRVSASVSIPSPRAGGAASEHLTDVTLDDVLKSLEKSKTDCFATYDECADLADKALQLRDQLHELADELAERHNVIGRLTSAAMHRLGESMDLLARRAEAMRTQSLHAAESVELAHDEMHDAYKPVQQAAADAGLVMPSARIHNED
ncbi:hypothetical protein [Streptomyces olivaceus]|uniref:hypothetical protein n=1 Tax=Streptomyces olivaceus TaxID=47716 RepID=UPI001CCE9230|nr:hypothetical protein [Streptomyces olivaceus]